MQGHGEGQGEWITNFRASNGLVPNGGASHRGHLSRGGGGIKLQPVGGSGVCLPKAQVVPSEGSGVPSEGSGVPSESVGGVRRVHSAKFQAEP